MLNPERVMLNLSQYLSSRPWNKFRVTSGSNRCNYSGVWFVLALKTNTPDLTLKQNIMKKIYALFLFAFVSMAAYSQCFVQYSSTPCTCFGLCNGTATANVSGGTPPYVYSWNNGQTTATATGLCAGSYNCMVVDALGNICASTSGANVTQPQQIFVNATGQNPTSCINCDGMVTGTATGGTQPFTYMWTPGNCPQQTTAFELWHERCRIQVSLGLWGPCVPC